MQLAALFLIVFMSFPGGFASAASGGTATAWVHNSSGPRFQYDRFRGACFDASGTQGMNPLYVGECGNLERYDLAGRDLTGINLRGANLKGADIHRAKLDNTDLREANLLYSNWEEATFQRARINGGTKLPFDAKKASASGMSIFEYADLDSKFHRDMKTWLATKPTTLAPWINQMILDGADYLASGGAILHAAIRSNTRVFLDYIFVERKLDPSATYNGFTPYLVTVADSEMISVERAALLRFFLKLGANPNSGYSNRLPLWIAAAREDLSSIGILLDASASTSTVVFGNSLLYSLVKSGHGQALKYLIDRGADLAFCRASDSPCSLVETAFASRSHYIQILLDARASCATTYFAGSMYDYVSNLALMQQLANLGADGRKAAVHNRVDTALIDFLLSQGASIDSQDAKGTTLLMNAIKTSNTKLIDYVISKNIDIDLKDSNGITALGYLFADEKLRDLYFQSFLAKGASPTQSVYLSKDYRTTVPLLKFAVDVGNRYFMPLARAGADINQPHREHPENLSYAITYILNKSEPVLSAQSEKEIRELASLGADFKTWQAVPKHWTPALVLEMDTSAPESKSPHFIMSRTKKAPVSISVAGLAAAKNKMFLLPVLKSIGIDLGGRQASSGETLAHLTSSVSDLKQLAQLGVALDGLNDNGQNAMYGKSPELIDELIRLGVPVLKADRHGDSILAYLDFSICNVDTSWIAKIVGVGLDPNLVSARYNLSLAHLIAFSLTGEESSSACAKKVFAELKPLNLDLNRIWKVESSSRSGPIDGYGLLGSSLNWAQGEFAILLMETDGEFAARRELLGLVKLWATLGYDVKVEAARTGSEFAPLLDRAYHSNNIELIYYLKRLIVEDGQRKTVPTTSLPSPRACDFFGVGPGYQLGGAGCLSTQTGIVWSQPTKRDDGASPQAHAAFCQSLGVDWKVPMYSDLMREFFTGRAQSNFAAYKVKNTVYSGSYAFNPSTGDNMEINTMVPIYFVCRYRFENEK